MNRSKYFNYIENKLSTLSYRIKVRGKINLLDLNIYSESFFADLFNLIYGYSLVNINLFTQNADGIDLVDDKNKIVMQVTSTNTKEKVEHSLSREGMREYRGYRFIFVLITDDGSYLKKKTYNNPYGLTFTPSQDIYDLAYILNSIMNYSVTKQKPIFDFIRKELEEDISVSKIDSNLTMIINALSEEDLSSEVYSPEINSFEIVRKIEFNKLIAVKSIIDEYKVYFSKINEKYKEYDKLGKNKSLSILNALHKMYVKKKRTVTDSVELFFSIIEEACNVVRNSQNYVETSFEELELCVSIVVVDAFIRCKIFENPEGYNHVIAR